MERNQPWTQEPVIVAFILDSYAGADFIPKSKANNRLPTGPKQERVFLYEIKGTIYIGNTRAFSLVLTEKFGIELRQSTTGMIHSILRQHGYALVHDSEHRITNEKLGKFKESEPWQEKA